MGGRGATAHLVLAAGRQPGALDGRCQKYFKHLRPFYLWFPPGMIYTFFMILSASVRKSNNFLNLAFFGKNKGGVFIGQLGSWMLWTVDGHGQWAHPRCF